MIFLFRNENWAVVEKKSGQLTVPSRFREEDQREVLGLVLQKEIGKPVFPVHRLDFEVSGVVLWALNPETHRLGQSWFEHKKIIKKYRAVSGLQSFLHWPENLKKSDEKISPEDRQIRNWKCQLSKGKRRAYESPRGLDCITEAQIVNYRSDLQQVYWDLFPVTGRSHQLRFEMSRHGFPILGDQLYGSQIKVQKGIALRAYELSLKRISESERKGLPEVVSVSPEIEGLE